MNLGEGLAARGGCHREVTWGVLQSFLVLLRFKVSISLGSFSRPSSLDNLAIWRCKIRPETLRRFILPTTTTLPSAAFFQLVMTSSLA